MQILVDQDGVLANFDLAFYQKWQASDYASEFPPIEYADRNTFYVAHQYPNEYRNIIYEMITEKGFFENLPPHQGAVEALQAMQQAGHDVFICTSPLSTWQHCVGEKFAWVEKHLGHEWTKCIIITKDKTLVRGDVLIDDKPNITGVMTPTWTHVFYDCPYNRPPHIKESDDRPRLTWQNWQQVLESI